VNTDNAGEGADWVPTGLSPNLIDRVELQLKVLALFTDADADEPVRPARPRRSPA
jgi:hypothetical protein